MKWLIGFPIMESYNYPYSWFVLSTEDYFITEDMVYFKEIMPITYFTSVVNRTKDIKENKLKILINSKYWRVEIYDTYEELLAVHFDKLI